jgi:hypothetical protein
VFYVLSQQWGKMMMKEISLATVAIFIVWSVLNFLVHGILLQPAYEETAELWRSKGEIKIGLGYFVSFMSALGFVLIYKYFFIQKSLNTALKFGLIYGLVAGANMGFGTYAYMPISPFLAWVWFIDIAVGGLVAGWVVGLMVKS